MFLPLQRAQFQSTWRDNASDEHGFKMERCLGSACTNFALVASVAANVIAFTDNGLLARTYTYRVRAFNSHGNSEYSNLAVAKTWR
jgi:tripartite motif-containing protein 71